MAISDERIILFVRIDDAVAEEAALRLLEEGKWIGLDNRWRARSDKPHTSGMKKHTHVYLKGREVYVINRDGTPSHNSDSTGMPPKVLQMLKSKKLVEGSLMESATAGRLHVYVPEAVIVKALEAIDRADMIARVMRNLGSR